MRFVRLSLRGKVHTRLLRACECWNIQIVRVVLKYIRDNPAAAHRKTNSLIMFSFRRKVSLSQPLNKS
jgi:hypothetical protein